MKGCYCLIIRLNKKSTIKIGKKLGNIEFKKGYYVYVGSAMNSLESRIKRHLSDEKKLHWHIDYFLKESEIEKVICNVSPKKVECELSQFIASRTCGIESFGCSDCDCESHLYYFKTKNQAVKCVKDAYNSLEIDFSIINP